MYIPFVNRPSLKHLCLAFLGTFVSYSCQREINQVARLAPPIVTAPSGMQIAGSVGELEKKVASVFHQDAQTIKVTRVDYLDSKVGYGCTIQYVNQLNKETYKMVMFSYGAAEGKSVEQKASVIR